MLLTTLIFHVRVLFHVSLDFLADALKERLPLLFLFVRLGQGDFDWLFFGFELWSVKLVSQLLQGSFLFLQDLRESGCLLLVLSQRTLNSLLLINLHLF